MKQNKTNDVSCMMWNIRYPHPMRKSRATQRFDQQQEGLPEKQIQRTQPGLKADLSSCLARSIEEPTLSVRVRKQNTHTKHTHITHEMTHKAHTKYVRAHAQTFGSSINARQEHTTQVNPRSSSPSTSGTNPQHPPCNHHPQESH